MPNNALFPLIGCALVFSAVGVDYGLGRLDVPKPHLLPVETFPAQVGDWKGGPLQVVSEDIQHRLPTAKIVERTYVDSMGRKIDLMLLTATEDEDMHSPQACFPSQGWTLSDIHATSVDGQPATRMTADIEGQQPVTVLYWLTGYYPSAPPRNALLRRASVFRTHFMASHSNMSLFVRVIAPASSLDKQTEASFMSAIRDPLNALIVAGSRTS